MSFRRSFVGLSALAVLAGGCASAPLPDASRPDPADSRVPVPPQPYQPVLAGTAPHLPVPLKSWRQLNEDVAPGAGRSP